MGWPARIRPIRRQVIRAAAARRRDGDRWTRSQPRPAAGARVTDGVLKGTVDRMWTAYRDFETSLKAGRGRVPGRPGRRRAVRRRRGDQRGPDARRRLRPQDRGGCGEPGHPARAARTDSAGGLAADRAGPADPLRVLAAKDLVDQMDADTRSKPMSSGMAIGIRWVRSDKLHRPAGTGVPAARPGRRQPGRGRAGRAARPAPGHDP